MRDPAVESWLDRIAAGEALQEADLSDALGGDSSLLRNLAVVGRLDRFHRELHADAERTVTGSVTRRHWGPLELRQPLGRGGFGEVHRAYDPKLQREVALKLFREDLAAGPAAYEQLLREARLLAKIRHEHVVGVYGVEEHEGRPGYWMELVEGKDLESHLRDEGPRSAEEARQIGAVLCRALAAVHEVGLVHRDVKTSNVVRARGGRLVLMDFGTVVASRDAAELGGSVSGTPAYMAPETLRGEAPSIATDIYAVGVTLFHLTTGSYPYEAKSLDELRTRQQSGPGRRLRDLRPDLPGDFCEVVERALDPDPDRRFATVGEFEHALSSVQRPSSRRSPRRRFLGLAAAALLGAIAAVMLWTREGASPTAMLIDARLYTLVEQRAEAIGDGSALAVGDPLWLELTTNQSAYVYVLNRDRGGEAHLLFPLPGYDTQNPIPAAERVELPGRRDGSRTAWQVSSAGGEEEILIVASAERLAQFESSLAILPAAGSAQTQLALGARQELELVRGVGQLVELPEASARDSGLQGIFAQAEQLGAETAVSSPIWVRKIRFGSR